MEAREARAIGLARGENQKLERDTSAMSRVCEPGSQTEGRANTGLRLPGEPGAGTRSPPQAGRAADERARNCVERGMRGRGAGAGADRRMSRRRIV
jgi:hypothetical protein